ncbi:MAG TPA: 4'-phosphopantetheinyl transferase superfamily protein [Acidimicrobiales bacterium]|nr:4'-phosphopantetheinyl transferase superfamily protein [Acidimicrobiales bacterium]
MSRRPGVPATVWWLTAGLADVPEGDGWLAPAEVEHQRGLVVAARRRDWRLRRWAAKQALLRVPGGPDEATAPSRLEVANRADGSPLARLDGAPLPVAVSLSDRAGLALCALAPAQPAFGAWNGAGSAPFQAPERGGGGDIGIGIGCDVELVEPRSDAFVADWLTDAEQRVVALAGPGGRDLAANLVWSAKESALKVLREGLRRPTRSVEVTVDPGAPPVPGTWAPLVVDRAEGGRLEGWWRPLGAHVLTVVTAGATAPPAAL